MFRLAIVLALPAAELPLSGLLALAFTSFSLGSVTARFLKSIGL